MIDSVIIAVRDFRAKNNLLGLTICSCNDLGAVLCSTNLSKSAEKTIYHGIGHDVFEFALQSGNMGVLRYDPILSDDYYNKCL